MLRPVLAAFLTRFDQGCPPGRVLEIGSADGRDAAFLESLGREMRRTDATRAFVEMLQQGGHPADVLNVLTDDLGGPYAGVLADAVFLHLTPEQLANVFVRIRQTLSPGGLLAFSVKIGEGSEWSSHKLGAPRWFQYWEETSLRTLLGDCGFDVVDLAVDTGGAWDWLLLLATPGMMGT